MKQKTILILFSILLPVFIYAQTTSTNDSLSQILNDEINFSKSNTSDIVWERIPIPTGFDLNSFLISNNDNLYIGSHWESNFGGVYQSNDYGITWSSTGLDNGQIHFIGQNSVGDLIVGKYSRIYIFRDNVWSEVYQSSTGDCYVYYGIDSLLFVGNGGIIKSDDDGNNWELVYDIPGSAEDVKAFTATTCDSVFMGSTNWLGLGGGVYLSTDGGDNWEHFGLSQHFVKSMAVDNYNMVYAGNGGHWETGQGGLYRYNYETAIWDTLHYFPYIFSIVFNTENYIYTGFSTSGMADLGGVMHSEDNGETWILDTAGIGNTWVNELQIDNNGFLYALTGYTTKKLYRSTLPVNIKEEPQHQNHALHCFPNPAENYINIAFTPVFHVTNEFYLSIYNVFGQSQIKRQLSVSEIENGIISLNISYLTAGCYVISINGNNYNIINKFTKQ